MKGVVFLVFCSVLTVGRSQYKPNWPSIDSRPLPTWYDEAKIGVFIHWGLFSVPSFGSEWFWSAWKISKSPDYINFMDKNFKPNFTYADFGPSFTAEFFNPDEWTKIFQESGIRYVVLTSKHHEGYTMWPSKVSWNWNSMDVGPNRDLVGELAESIRKNSDIRFGLYHSMFEWFNPLYLEDKQNNWQTNHFVTRKCIPELSEIVNKYKPEVIWSDGDWEAPHTYWNSTVFLAWLYNKSPVRNSVVVNDRWGMDMPCHHGGYYTCTDKYNPGTLQPHKWENCMTIDKGSWGYRRNAQLDQYLTIEELIQTVTETVSCGGNILINVGPTHDGRIIPIFEERLRQLGSWLKVNGDAIYGTVPFVAQNDTLTSGVWYTAKPDTAYAIVLNWPKDNQIILGAIAPSRNLTISMLGVQGNLPWKKASPGGILVAFPLLTPDVIPCQWAWVLKFTGLANQFEFNNEAV